MSEKKKGLNIKFSQGTLDRIDEQVRTGKYSTPSDFISKATEWYLNQEEFKRNQRADLLVLIKTDPELRREIIESLKKIALEELQK